MTGAGQESADQHAGQLHLLTKGLISRAVVACRPEDGYDAVNHVVVTVKTNAVGGGIGVTGACGITIS